MKHVFYATSDDKSRHLWLLCRYHHLHSCSVRSRVTDLLSRHRLGEDGIHLKNRRELILSTKLSNNKNIRFFSESKTYEFLFLICQDAIFLLQIGVGSEIVHNEDLEPWDALQMLINL